MTLNNTLRRIIIAGVFSVFIIPFLVPSNMFFPFITGKGFFFRTMVEIIFAAWIVLSLRDASVRPRKSWMLWAFLAFAVIIGVADIFGVNPWKSFWSNFERMEGYITTLHLLAYFLVASCVLSTEKVWKRFLEWSVWSSLLMAFYGTFQLAGLITINQGGVRVDGTFGNATYLAIFMVFNIFFALILINRDKEVWKKVVYGVIAFYDFIILYHTATRGSILGLLGGLLLSAMLIALFDKKERKLRIVFGSIAGAVVLLVLGFIGVKNASFVQHSPVLSRFASISWADTQTQARAYIWPMAIEGFKERPILGWGQENFNYIFNKDYDPRMFSQEQWFDHAHNTVLDWLVTGGILGLLAYLSLFVAAGYLLWKKSSDMTFTEKALFTGLGAAYFFHNLFVFDNIVSYILFVSLLAFVHFKSTRLEKPIGGESDNMEDDDTKLAGPIALLALIFVIYFFNWRGYATNVYLIEALRTSATQQVDPQAALNAFDKALSYDTLGRPELVERIVQAVPAMNGANVPIDIRQKFRDIATKAVEEQLARFPGDARYETFAGTFYSYYGENDKAEEHFLKAVELSPRKQTIMFQLGSFYLTTRQFDKGLAVFKKAYDLDHDYTDAAKYYAVALVYNGKDADAKALLQSASLDTSMTDDNFLRAFIDLGNWPRVIAILKARAAANPTDMSTLQNLAAAYYQSGDKQGAIATVRQMEALDPSFKTTGDQYIQAIQSR
ncbi:MAG TPA: O-antigen ligase family protein [Candidatus Paceibacterota bacterium]|nr:O-antigen ligase family protein [Candidatus Paceibacterota bacterium]